MSTAQILGILAIGAAVGALTYYSFFRRTKAAEQRAEGHLIQIPIPALPKIIGREEETAEKPERPVHKAKISTPIKAICAKCKKVATMPFRCRFCSGLFCGDHRLPENHSCEAL